MRALRLDAVLDLELFARVSAILAGLSGAKIRVGFHRFTQEGLYRGDIMNRPVLYNPYQHISQQFVTLADAIGSTGVPTAKRLVSPAPLRLPALVLRPGELESAREALYRRHPSIAGRPLVFLCPGAGLLPIRAWPLASFGIVAKDLIGRGYAVAIVGLAEDRELAQAIQRACDSAACVDLTGYTQTMRDVAVLLHLGVLLVTNDGGTDTSHRLRRLHQSCCSVPRHRHCTAVFRRGRSTCTSRCRARRVSPHTTIGSRPATATTSA
jgi:ADP-heptose:LPS heptosyltransferase